MINNLEIYFFANTYEAQKLENYKKLDNENVLLCFSRQETEEAIKKFTCPYSKTNPFLSGMDRCHIIITTDLSSLSTDLFDKNFKVFVHRHQFGDFMCYHEIKLGNNIKVPLRTLKKGHNLLNLFLAGEF